MLSELIVYTFFLLNSSVNCIATRENCISSRDPSSEGEQHVLRQTADAVVASSHVGNYHRGM